VIPLGPESGEILANVNRWEKQLQLPPTAADKLEQVAHGIDVNGLKATVVDLTSPDSASPRQRMLAAIVPTDERVWFFKMVGPSEIVAAQKQNFDQFVRSIKPSEASAPIAADTGAASTNAPRPKASAAPAVKLSHWLTPTGWTEIPGATPPRVLAFSIGDGEKKAETVVTKFPAGGAGDYLSNINRWRGQIGLTPITDAQSVPMKDVSVGSGGKGILVEFHNPDAGKRMIVVIGTVGGELWFYKLSGAGETVEAQREPFASFVKSVDFGPVAAEGNAK
jgi:hypothetical protein